MVKKVKKVAKKGAAKKIVKKAAVNNGLKNAALLGVEAVTFSAMAPGSISRDEIYHRLEWYFDPSHNPKGGHSIDGNTPIKSFFSGMSEATGRQVLWVNLNKTSATYVPAWKSPLFHGVQFPWVSKPPIAIGIRDLPTFGRLIDSAVLSYQHANWTVTP